MEIMTLFALPAGRRAAVARLDTAGALRRRLLDIGLTPGAEVTALFRGRGGITACRIRGAVIALRRADADTVLVSLSPGKEAADGWV